MRKLVSIVLGAIAFGSAAPALGAESISHELAFTDDSIFFDPAISADQEADAAFDVYPLPAEDVLPGEQTIALAAPKADSADYGGLLNAVSAVPEPSVWMAMILGLGAVGYILRTRKRALPQAV